MQPGQENDVITVVKQVFDQFVGPGFSQEGRKEFYKYANEEALSERSKINHFTILAQENETITGIIEIRDFSHVAMFFVLSGFQKQGIGKKLLNEAVRRIKKEQDTCDNLTVNSSPNAVDAYNNLGFTTKSDEQCINGIRFVPMSLDLAKFGC